MIAKKLRLKTTVLIFNKAMRTWYISAVCAEETSELSSQRCKMAGLPNAMRIFLIRPSRTNSRHALLSFAE